MGNCGGKRERRYLIDRYDLNNQQLQHFEALYKGHAGLKNYINFSDFKKLYSEARFEHSDEDLQAVFSVFSSKGKMQLPEFVRLCLMCTADCPLAEEERLKALFDVMDCDASGFISDKEFRQFLSNFTEDTETASKYFSQVDADDSKMIDFAEFCSFCQNHKRMAKVMIAYVFPTE